MTPRDDEKAADDMFAFIAERYDKEHGYTMGPEMRTFIKGIYLLGCAWQRERDAKIAEKTKDPFGIFRVGQTIAHEIRAVPSQRGEEPNP